MEKAKAAVSQFVGRAGHHDTTVDERQRAAVVQEGVQPVRHEEVQTAVKREIDKDHYHTTIQPIKDREVLPEKHSHQMAAVQTKEFEHAKPHEIKARLDSEAQQFRDTSTTHSTKTTQAIAPTIEGERVHHHVHETIQPVIEKEVIAPSVVHTTVPVHERHHAAPEHHGVSVLPTKTMADFKSTGHNLTSNTGIINQDQYDGCPRPYNPEMQLGDNSKHGSHIPAVGAGMTGTHGSHTSAGPHSSDMGNKMDPRVDSDRDGSNRGMGTGMGTGTGIGTGTGTGAGMGGMSNTTAGPHGSNAANKLDPRIDSDRSGDHHTGVGNHMGTFHDASGHKKPSLLDKLNPLKDSDGDGKKGFMK